MKSVAKGAKSKQESKRESSALWLPGVLTLLLAAFTLLSRVNANAHLTASFLGAAALLAAGVGVLWWNVSRAGRTLTYEFVPRPVHWVQLLMHSSVYAYWGWYWREVYNAIPLILAQVVFLYVLDMVVCWLRRDKWILGFGPIPIIFSTNLFLWFRDDWYYLQFATVVMIVLGKEFLRWKRDGQSVHIFNPSAFALFVTSVILIATRSTSITWGEEIATTFLSPPSFFVEIFVVGLIVQALFSVTLVTLSAAVTLFVINVVYTGSTGTYLFIDTNIHPAIFLGLHLLVTDPATSPRKNFGKFLFGAAYGASLSGLVPVLEGLGAPVFYDKLLCVPLLNLTVRVLDRWSPRLEWPPFAAWTPRQVNLGFMGIWVAFFVFMVSSGFLSDQHPGTDSALWDRACAAGGGRECEVLARMLDVQCQRNSGDGCLQLGTLLSDGKRLPRVPIGAARSLGRSCDLGSQAGCMSLAGLVAGEGEVVLQQPCELGDSTSCFMLGSLYAVGQSVPRNLERSAALYQQSCTGGFLRACGTLATAYINGQGVPPGVLMEAKIQARFREACGLGHQDACRALERK
jgi:TPR repeat protein